MDIGDRMKSYEKLNQIRLPDAEAMFVRVDGKAFHTWAKKIDAAKPFDRIVHQCMAHATRQTAREIQGFRLAYTQSDEATFLFHNLEPGAKAWFDGKVSKLVSITASLFTYYFNDYYSDFVITHGYPRVPAFFDSRAFSTPVEDAANVFVWREQDWRRNSVQMMGQHYFGHRHMQGLDSTQVIADLRSEHGIDWFSLTGWQRYGIFVIKTDGLSEARMLELNEYCDYYAINKLAGMEKYLEDEIDA